MGDAGRAAGLQAVHGHHLDQLGIAERVHLVYDFALPPLVLHALHFGDAGPLRRWIDIRPGNALTVLDTHDGIGIIDIGPDQQLAGLVTPEELEQLVESIHHNSKYIYNFSGYNWNYSGDGCSWIRN